MLLESQDNKASNLELDPGVSKRKRRSTCKLLLWTLLWVVLIAVVVFISRVVWGIFSSISNPHKSMQYEEKGKAVLDIEDVPPSKRISVVQPLVGQKQKFDIIANVWMRETEGGKVDAKIDIGGEEYPERLVASERVFSGVTLKDKYVFANVTFRIPTQHFKQKNLTNHDLRASFVLVPNNPSLLDYAVNFTTWKKDGLNFPAMRSWVGRQPDLLDQIIDSYGITIPLLQFHNIASRCPTSHGNQKPRDEDSIEDMEDADEIDSEQDSAKAKAFIPFRLAITDDAKVTDSHPYIVTRTHLRVIEETRLYKRLAYNTAQKGLRDKLCSLSSSSPKSPRWHDCMFRLYGVTGVWETKVQLEKPNRSGKPRTEWAYAPFMSALQLSPGPRDLMAVPVNRENCPENAETGTSIGTDQDYVTVTWKLSYSGRTPVKMNFADHGVMISNRRLNMTESDAALDRIHHEQELTSGLFGHRFHSHSHPRRLRFSSFLRHAFLFLSLFLDIHYWYTRTSCVGISRPGTILLAVGLILDEVVGWAVSLWYAKDPTTGLASWIGSFLLWSPLMLGPGILMLKAVHRIEVEWRLKQSWLPKLSVASPSHAERRSERIEGQTKHRTQVLIFLAMLGTVYLLRAEDRFLIQPRVPNMSDSETMHPAVDFVFLIVAAFNHTGFIFQNLMNHYSGTFAGRHKLSVFLRSLAALLEVGSHLPIFLGSTTDVNGMTMMSAFGTVLLAVELWQALIYRKVPQNENGNEE